MSLSSIVSWGARLGLGPRWLVGAVGILRDDRNRVFLAHHRVRRAPWGLPGGLMRWPEGPASCVARELVEECGLELPPQGFALVGALPSDRLALLDLILAFERPLSSHEVARLRPDGFEITEIRWVDRTELGNLSGLLQRHREFLESFLLLPENKGVSF